jgi:hypothetical protein
MMIALSFYTVTGIIYSEGALAIIHFPAVRWTVIHVAVPALYQVGPGWPRLWLNAKPPGRKTNTHLDFLQAETYVSNKCLNVCQAE